MTVFTSTQASHRDATAQIVKHLPGGDPERYAQNVMETYGKLITNEERLPITTEYWSGLYPAAKLVTVSTSDYDHADSEQKARLLFESCMAVACFNPTFCITSYYDLLNVKEIGDAQCIIVIMHLRGSLLNIIGRWDDDMDFHLHKPADINAPADPSWRGVTSANISLIHDMPELFHDSKAAFMYMRSRGFNIEYHTDEMTQEMIDDGLNITVERLNYMARVVSGEVDINE